VAGHRFGFSQRFVSRTALPLTNRRPKTRLFLLGLRWLDTALDFPISALSRHPKLRQAGAPHDTLTAPKRLGQQRNSIPNLSRLRVSPFPLLPDARPSFQISNSPQPSTPVARPITQPPQRLEDERVTQKYLDLGFCPNLN
jgi:hypothetical protein